MPLNNILLGVIALMSFASSPTSGEIQLRWKNGDENRDEQSIDVEERLVSVLDSLQKIYHECIIADSTFYVKESDRSIILRSQVIKIEFSKDMKHATRILPLKPAYQCLTKSNLTKVTKSNARQISDLFVEKLLGTQIASQFDSVSTYSDSNELEFMYTTMDHEHISDGRYAKVVVDRDRGFVKWYSARIAGALPSGYTPIVSRSEAEKRIYAYAEENEFKVRIHYLKVTMGSVCAYEKKPVWTGFVEVGRKQNGQVQWIWSPCEMCPRCAICVDVETGEVIGTILPNDWTN